MCVRLATSNSCSHQLIMSKTQSYSSPALVPNHPLGSNSSKHPHQFNQRIRQHFLLFVHHISIIIFERPKYCAAVRPVPLQMNNLLLLLENNTTKIHYLHSQLHSSLKEEIPMPCCCFFNLIFIKQGMCRFIVQNPCHSIQNLTEHFSKWQPLGGD